MHEIPTPVPARAVVGDEVDAARIATESRGLAIIATSLGIVAVAAFAIAAVIL